MKIGTSLGWFSHLPLAGENVLTTYGVPEDPSLRRMAGIFPT
jgi:hypothetical protein